MEIKNKLIKSKIPNRNFKEIQIIINLENLWIFIKKI